MIKNIYLIVFGLLFSATAAAGNDLMVKVQGVNSGEGAIRMALYDNAKKFRKEKKAITVQETKASTEEVTFKIRDLPAGDYAVYVFHDKDGDRNFDHMLGLFPTEGYGLSVNSDLNASESFENSRFTHVATGDSEVSVVMRYCGSNPDKTVTKTLSCWISLSP